MALQLLVDMVDGVGATLDLPLVILPTSGTAALDVRRSQFAALLPSLAPSATPSWSSSTVAVRAYPRTLTSATYASLVSVPSATYAAASTDLNLGVVSYARPFPAWFVEARSFDYLAFVKVPAALGAGAASVAVSGGRLDPAGATDPIAPTLGPVRLPLVAGRDALQPQAGVGLTPTLSWSPPATGAATRYVVAIVELVNGSYSTRATLILPGTSIVVPPRVLVPGSVYVAVISAYDEPNFDFAAPLEITLPREFVPFVTAPFAP